MTSEEKSNIFEELYNRKYKYVVQFCKRYLSHHEAEELAQEIFIQVFNGLETFKGKSKIDTWLYAVTRNACNNRFRYNHSKKRYAPEVSLSEIMSKLGDDWDEGHGVAVEALEDTSAENPLENVEFQQTKEIVMKGIGRLSENEQVCILTFVNNDGISYQDVSERLGIPVNTVKSRLSRSRVKLKRKIKTIATAMNLNHGPVV